MATNLKISVKDEQSARQWLAQVEEINEAYRVAMKDAGDTLVDMENFAEGTAVDELVKYGTMILDAGQKTFEAIGTIADTVTTIISKVQDFTQNALGTIGSAIGKIFG